ncbi:MAG: capsid cement protein, partial [Terriglobia bacterium]
NYFVPQGTDPSTVTGTTPVLYNLLGRGVTVQTDGIARFYAASAIAQGDAVNIADVSGRVKTATETAGTQNNIGFAQNAAAAINDVVIVRIAQHKA